jgi:putative DNA primase/helicase
VCAMSSPTPPEGAEALTLALMVAGYGPGERFELAASKPFEAGRFTNDPDGVRAAMAFVREQDGRKNLYLGGNPLRETISGGRATAQDVTETRLLLIDCDPTRGEGDPDGIGSERRQAAATLAGAVCKWFAERGYRPRLVDSGRGRQILILHEPCRSDADMHSRAELTHGLQRRFSGPLAKIDSTADPSRLIRLIGTTNLKTGRRAQLLKPGDGEPVSHAVLSDWAAELAPPPRPTVARPFVPTAACSEVERIESALGHVSAEDYDVWLKVGMALHAWGNPSGRSLWDTWSSQSEKYDAGAQEAKWASFRPGGSSGSGVTLGTLFHLAEQHGWDRLGMARQVAEGALRAVEDDPSRVLDTAVVRAFCLLKRRAPSEWAAIRNSLTRARQVRVQEVERAIERSAREERLSEVQVAMGVPVIDVTPQIMAMANAAESALEGNQIAVYQRGGELVRVVEIEGRHQIVPVALPTLTEFLAACAVWVNRTERGPNPVEVPKRVVEALAARKVWDLPVLSALTDAPVLRQDGSILDEPGYDEASGILYLPSCEFPPVPLNPSKDDALAARDLLLEIFCDFPFVDKTDQAAALAVVLTLVGRSAIDGPTPLFGVSAPVPGTGKDLALAVCGLIAHGRAPDPVTVPSSDEEERKLLHSLGRDGVPFAVLCNSTGQLGSDVLNAMLTSTTYSGRVLGKSSTVSVPVPVFAATGNNLRYRGDMSRRVIPVRLDPQCERPELRDSFRHPGLLAHVRKERPRLLVAVLTILRWHFSERSPAVGLAPLGSFESWSKVVRNALLRLGEADPVAGQERIRETADPFVEAATDALAVWHSTVGTEPITARELCRRASGDFHFADALAALVPKLRADALEANALGRRFSEFAGRIFGGLRLQRVEPRTSAGIQWQVLREHQAGGSV